MIAAEFISVHSHFNIFLVLVEHQYLPVVLLPIELISSDILPNLNKKVMVDATTRIVPGAPPPTPVSKSQKKKRKAVKGKLGSAEPDNPIIPDTTTASVSDQKPEVSDEKEATVPPNHVVAPSASEAPPSATEDDIGYKPSPVVDLVHKRLKAIHKKIVSIV
jgi:hypothetical protein